MARRVRHVESEGIDNCVASAYLARITAHSAEAATALTAVLEEAVVLDGELVAILVLAGAVVVIFVADRGLTAKLKL